MESSSFSEADRGSSSSADGGYVDDYLRGMPIGLSAVDLLDHTSTDSEDKTIVVSCRIPIQWIEQIEEIRQRPGTKLPNLWPKRADFIRWCVLQGFKGLITLDQYANEDNPLDPIVNAQVFLEKEIGSLTARARTMGDAKDKVSVLATAITALIDVGEHQEAAALIQRWIDGASQQSDPFWHDYLIKVLTLDTTMLDGLRKLFQDNLLDNDYLEGLVDRTNFIPAIPPSIAID